METTGILDGKGLSEQIKEEVAQEVTAWVDQGHRPPHLAAVLVGEDGASKTYVDHKVRSCARVGFESTLIVRPADIEQSELLEIVRGLNENPDIDGFIVQLPLPDHLDAQAVTEALLRKKMSMVSIPSTWEIWHWVCPVLFQRPLQAS